MNANHDHASFFMNSRLLRERIKPSGYYGEEAMTTHSHPGPMPAVYLPSGGHYEERVQDDVGGRAPAYHVTSLDSSHQHQRPSRYQHGQKRLVLLEYNLGLAIFFKKFRQINLQFKFLLKTLI